MPFSFPRQKNKYDALTTGTQTFSSDFFRKILLEQEYNLKNSLPQDPTF